MRPAHASLFFVPIFEYASQKVNDTCRGADGNASSHRQRVALAAAKLSASPWWQRYRGADHAFATSAYSYGGRGAGTANLRHRLGGLLGGLLRRGASGRYKPGLTATSVGRCVVGVPWHSVKLAAAGLQVPAGVSGSGAPLPWPRSADGVGGDGANGEVGGGGGPRRLLLHFAGSLDVVGMHANVRCAVGPLAAAAVGVADVAVRLTLPANASRWGNCARRAMALLAAARNGAEGGRGGEGGGGSGGGESAPAVSAAGEGRSPGESFVRQTLREMSEATFCLMPAGDNSARSIMYTALALGCIPVVLSLSQTGCCHTPRMCRGRNCGSSRPPPPSCAIPRRCYRCCALSARTTCAVSRPPSRATAPMYSTTRPIRAPAPTLSSTPRAASAAAALRRTVAHTPAERATPHVPLARAVDSMATMHFHGFPVSRNHRTLRTALLPGTITVHLS